MSYYITIETKLTLARTVISSTYTTPYLHYKFLNRIRCAHICWCLIKYKNSPWENSCTCLMTQQGIPQKMLMCTIVKVYDCEGNCDDVRWCAICYNRRRLYNLLICCIRKKMTYCILLKNPVICCF